jgi:mycoredoxin
MMKQQASQPIIVYSAAWCGDSRRAKRFLDTQGVSYLAIDIEHDVEAMALVKRLNKGRRSVPTIIFDGFALRYTASGAVPGCVWMVTVAAGNLCYNHRYHR